MYFRTLLSLLILATIALGLTACKGCNRPTPVASNEVVKQNNPISLEKMQSAADAERDFSTTIYPLLKGDNNFIYSPYSLWSALSMTCAGANGNTKTEMATALRLNASDPSVHEAIGALNEVLKKKSGIEDEGFRLNIKNDLWLEKSYQLKDSFLATTKANYDAKASLLDFKNDAEGSRVTINSSIEKDTEGKIKDLIPEGVLTPVTRLVLTNAIYLKAKWFHSFKHSSTYSQDFNIGTSIIKTDMMHNTETFRVADDANYTAVEMPYLSSEFALVALLPKNDLKVLESTFTGAMFKKLRDIFKSERIELAFPKFKVESTMALNPALESSGMKDAFDEKKADFSMMTEKNDLFISQVLQKAFIQVDEEGTEAAAATAVIMVEKSMASPEQLRRITFDKPFAYAIWHVPTSTVLFMGRLTNPKG